MFLLGNIIEGFAQILNLFLTFYMYIVFGRVIISWVNADPFNPIVKFLHRATEPVMQRLRRTFPILSNVGGLDLTPLVVVAFIFFLQTALVGSLLDLARNLSTK